MATSTVKLMFKPQTEGLRELRSLGWIMDDYQFGERFPRTIAHTGFTGTSLCLVPEHDVGVVLLTNRVLPSRANEKIQEVRKQFHDAIAAALTRRA